MFRYLCEFSQGKWRCRNLHIPFYHGNSVFNESLLYRKITSFAGISLRPGPRRKVKVDKAGLQAPRQTNTRLLCQFSDKTHSKSQQKSYTGELKGIFLHNFLRLFPSQSGSSLFRSSVSAPSWPTSVSAQMSALPQRNTHLCTFRRVAQKMGILKRSKIKNLEAFNYRMSMF